LIEAFEATGLYFSYPKMDKVMKQVENLEGEVNYKLLKAKVSQQIKYYDGLIIFLFLKKFVPFLSLFD
jgi:tetrahydromethanopterin S-methyltransferase subunit G